MKNLEHYIDHHNNWNALFGADPLTFEDSDKIFDSLEGDLSPENLTCDGERSTEEVQKRYDYLQAVWSELEEATGTTREQ